MDPKRDHNFDNPQISMHGIKMDVAGDPLHDSQHRDEWLGSQRGVFNTKRVVRSIMGPFWL